MADSDVDTPPYAATCETDACPCNQCRNADVSSYECRGGKDLNARRWAAVELLNPAKSMRPRYEIRLGALDTIRMCGLHLRRAALTLGHDLRASGSSAAACRSAGALSHPDLSLLRRYVPARPRDLVADVAS
jgi:hypothetical protein